MLLAYRFQTLADGLRDSDQDEECEKKFRLAQSIISEIYGEEHPAILSYNGNLITCLNVQMRNEEPDQQKNTKAAIIALIAKNFELANKTYGSDSIHVLYFVSTTLTNKIAIGEISSPTEMNPLVKQMREIVTKFHGGDPRNLNNQLFF